MRGAKKKGGSNRSHAQMQLFREAIDECGFIDMGYKGSPFTWKKKFLGVGIQFGRDWIEV